MISDTIKAGVWREEYAIRTFRCSITYDPCDLGGRCFQCETARSRKDKEILVGEEQ